MQEYKKNPPYPQETERAVSFLRKQATPAEQKLWAVLRQNRKGTMLKFRRQHPIGPYIADFYCHELKCVIEVDGSSHDSTQEKDQKRDAYMEQKGLKIFRFSDRDVQKNPNEIIESVLRDLKISLNEAGQQNPPPSGGS